jgi:hypothetical protein
VACPARTACIAVGGFENDGPGSVSLAERWRGSRTSAAQTTPGAISPQTRSGIVGCIRAALGEGVATGAAAPSIGPRFKAPMPQQSQPASGIERVTSLCSTAWPGKLSPLRRWARGACFTVPGSGGWLTVGATRPAWCRPPTPGSARPTGPSRSPRLRTQQR